jgi:hypothetical protein
LIARGLAMLEAMPRPIVLLPLLLLLNACDSRPPIVRSEVGSLAQNLQVREGLAWGDPTDLQPPAPFEGHRWWQVAYAGGQVILVDADSGWARLPPPGYAIRRTPAASTAPATAQAAPVTVSEGSWILVVEPSRRREPADLADLEREASRLNALAGQTALYPLFSVRTDHQGRSALVYGWQGDRGIAQDPRITTWLGQRTAHRDHRWVDLLAGDR